MRPTSPLLLIAALLGACTASNDPADSESSTSTSSATATEPTTGDEATGAPVGDCSGWDMLSDFYPDVDLGSLRACDAGQAAIIAGSLMNLDGITIVGDSVVGSDGSNTATPCIEVLCDADFAYIASNALPTYNPQAQPVFKTMETPIVHRIPLAPAAISPDTPADPWLDRAGCEAALSMAVHDEVPAMPPSSHCWYETEDGSANTGRLYATDGEEVVHKIHCYGQTAGLITGIPAFSPCEEARPDSYGSPLFNAYEDPDTLFVDYCGTHPAAITHNHWLNEVCLARDEDRKPLNSYATGAASFVLEALDAADCTVESEILGWAYDGYPLRGTCICLARDNEGACIDLRRARSGYVYEGINRWADDASDDPNIHKDTVMATQLGTEMQTCTTRADCCAGADQNCWMYCHPLLVEVAGGAVELERRCVTPDYSWCGHEFLPHADVLADKGYVYLDRCNGVETADGYVYVGTPTFPYVNSCYKGTPSAMATDDTYTRLNAGMGPGPGGGGGPPP